MYAFVDETGNTGKNVFDSKQPDFFTGAFVTNSNFDILHANTLRDICQRNGFNFLHASALGFEPIERSAPDVLSLLKRADARFIVSRVEKKYLVATKVFDTFFDSGENPAASWHVYNIKFLKLVLCFKVATLLTQEISRDFWDMLMARTEKEARSKIPEICDSILARVPLVVDQRSRDLITEALSWSRSHPEALDIFINRRQAKNGHMPNMVAFANLLEGLERLSKRRKRPLKKIVHDRQSQFESSLAEWHRMFSNASHEPIHRPGEAYVLQRVAGSTFEVSASDDSAGIQIADLMLWLVRQLLSDNKIPENSALLLRYILKRGYQNDFSFKGVGDLLQKQYTEVMAADLSLEELEAGQRILARQEQRKKQLIELYEDDGLMPYQRELSKLIPFEGE